MSTQCVVIARRVSRLAHRVLRGVVQSQPLPNQHWRGTGLWLRLGGRSAAGVCLSDTPYNIQCIPYREGCLYSHTSLSDTPYIHSAHRAGKCSLTWAPQPVPQLASVWVRVLAPVRVRPHPAGSDTPLPVSHALAICTHPAIHCVYTRRSTVCTRRTLQGGPCHRETPPTVDRQSRSGAREPAYMSGQISSRDQHERPGYNPGLSGRLTCMVRSTVL
jgi:hypothetical protein